MTSTWDRARAVADAVLYEGYLLYPYRGTSSKNQSRWQFGVLGPPEAAESGLGEDDTLSADFLVDDARALTLVVRFLQLQHRRAERVTGREALATMLAAENAKYGTSYGMDMVDPASNSVFNPVKFGLKPTVPSIGKTLFAGTAILGRSL